MRAAGAHHKQQTRLSETIHLNACWQNKIVDAINRTEQHSTEQKRLRNQRAFYQRLFIGTASKRQNENSIYVATHVSNGLTQCYTKANLDIAMKQIKWSMSIAPSDQDATKIMQKIIEKGRVIRGWLGIEASSYKSNGQLVIDKVTSGGPAFKAGIKAKDVIYQIADIPITSISQALDVVAETQPDTTLIFKIIRNKERLELPVTIIEKTTP